MNISSAYIGDRIPTRQEPNPRYVSARCEGAPPKGFVCVSCFTYVANVYNLVEHLGLMLAQVHSIAEHCAACHGYHPLTADALAQIRSHAQLWPMALPDEPSPSGPIADAPPLRESSG